ncbi:sensor histidine kinase [Paenibacillus flagellatus]|uniref:histidine kinase n=1 Tax=Paenibacillus flagellatus TaxID=2211139 RepID=A0A2V5K908_9BACL|nr:HAMP domain-containing sensor histidine kinase [Paenibacillus flagellatus]PYI55898.1 sensor histidine kinase [Paenibacillus flagellatus]
MKALPRKGRVGYMPFVVLVLFHLAFWLGPPLAHGESGAHAEIAHWEFRWDTRPDTDSPPANTDALGAWTRLEAGDPLPDQPDGAVDAWVKFELPAAQLSEWRRPGLFVDKLYAHRVELFAGERKLFESDRDYSYDVYKLAIPLDRSETDRTYYLKISSKSDRLGLHRAMEVAEYDERLSSFYRNDAIDIVLGGSLAFFAAIMLVCSIFLRKSQLPRWISLALVILTTGVLVASYTPLPYTYFAPYGKLFLVSFDLSLFLFLPMLLLFIEKTLDAGRSSLLARLRQFQVVYSAFCVAFMLFNELTDTRFMSWYYFFTVTVLGIVMVVQLAVLVGVTAVHAFRGHTDAIIMSAGFGLFAATGAGELVWFYARSLNYELFLWKWAVLGFVLAFIVVLARRFANDHERVLRHSKELELYNNRLQRHEKMEIISELAASVAHEVRNPLQVTRGFIQLLCEKGDGKEKAYLQYALEELDRASGIITDFLTFAKPQLDDVTVLRLSDEFEHIEGILVPMAHLQGGEIRVDVEDDLYVRGNSSKLKQAFVNIIKNSIEALNGEGKIEIRAYRELDDVVVRVIDNGHGMDEDELSRLGEPYFSSKTKGTGLGLMVTFRIIEVMQGRLEFISKKGVGTEAIVRFPYASSE